MPVDRSTDTHRVVDIDPHNPVHQAIVSNPGGSNVLIKNGRLHFPLPGVRGAEESPAAPVVKPESAPAPVKKPTKKPAFPKPSKAIPVKTGMASLADKERAKKEAIAKHNAILKAKKLGK